MLSRVKHYHNKTFKDKKGNLKQGHEYFLIRNAYGWEELGIILRWQDGRLQDDGDLPAVEFQDAHFERFRNGLLHCDETDEEGNLKPAIVASRTDQLEYYLNGKEVDKTA